MKRLISVLLVLAMCVSVLNVFAQNDTSEMENALLSVKQKIDIPSEAEKFESNTYKRDNKSEYSFRWYSEDYSVSVNVTCDGKGRISSYSAYNRNEENKEYPRLSVVPRETVFEKADAFVKKAVPDLFENSADCLVYDEKNSTSSLNYDNTSYRFVYNRIYDGISVLNNYLNVDVTVKGENIFINNMRCVWYYDREFVPCETSPEDITDAYFKQYPLEMIYDKQHNYMPLSAKVKEADKVHLLYRFRDRESGYISYATGEKITPDSADEYGYTQDSAADEYATAAMGALKNESAFSEAELKEIKEVAGLISREDAEKTVKSYPELQISGLDFSAYTVSKADEKYYVSLNMTDKEQDKHYFYSTMDGKTGEILSISNYKYDENVREAADEDYVTAREIASRFVKKAAGDKLSEYTQDAPEEKSSYVNYTRFVNGVKYIDNTIRCGAAVVSNYVRSYNISYDDDISDFANPANSISFETAYEKAAEYAPISVVYLLSDGKFVKAAGHMAGNSLEIDALTGKRLILDYARRINPEYTDILGHWCENIAVVLARVGIGFDRNELKPDDTISQLDFMRFMMNVFHGGSNYRNAEPDYLYEGIYNMGIISEDERNDEAPVIREDAFWYMIKFMDMDKIASMDIFRSDFYDAENISANRIGSAALLTGFGVVNGDDGSLRPKDSLTNAEALSLVYNYLTKN